ncbi:MAG: DUF3871 family protein [Taibaiella sp.]|nr:DUF3871 family protein [Taibaiella sp.]
MQDNEPQNEPIQVGEVLHSVLEQIEVKTSDSAFIEANTTETTLEAIRNEHIIPVFIKDNEPVISHAEFIDTAFNAVGRVFPGEAILKPNIRLSHPIKGRIPEAKNKPASDLLEHEKTIYYERMAFVIEVPTIQAEVGGNLLNLTIGGVKAYNLDNLYNRSGADQHFKVFVGFQNKVCTNLCVATDGLLSQLKVKNIDQLSYAIYAMLKDYNTLQFANELKSFDDYELTEKQFVHLIGRCRMFKHMPDSKKEGIRELTFGDNQINAVCREYYSDSHFKSFADGSINLWRLYNLFTGANKSTYIDNFLDRSANAYQLAKDIQYSLQNSTRCWYLN